MIRCFWPELVLQSPHHATIFHRSWHFQHAGAHELPALWRVHASPWICRDASIGFECHFNHRAKLWRVWHPCPFADSWIPRVDLNDVRLTDSSSFIEIKGNPLQNPWRESNRRKTSGASFVQQVISWPPRILKELYDSQEAAFLSNIGSLAEPLSKDQWEIGTGQRSSAKKIRTCLK